MTYPMPTSINSLWDILTYINQVSSLLIPLFLLLVIWLGYLIFQIQRGNDKLAAFFSANYLTTAFAILFWAGGLLNGFLVVSIALITSVSGALLKWLQQE